MKNFIQRILFLLVVSCISFNCVDGKDKKAYNPLKDEYLQWKGAVNRTIQIESAKEIEETTKNEILGFAKQINEFIIEKNVEGLIGNISQVDFRYYNAKMGNSKNLAKTIVEELRNKGYEYNFLFDKKKLTKGKVWASKRGKNMDVRKYLIEYKDKLKWRIFYIPKSDVYEAWFSIPNDLLIDFLFFHYRIKKQKGKYSLIGF